MYSKLDNDYIDSQKQINIESVSIQNMQMKPIDIKASSLCKGSYLCHISCPVGPECFYPYRKFISNILEDVSRNLTEEFRENLNNIYNQIQYWSSAVSYEIVEKPEEYYTRTNLDHIFDQIVKTMNDDNFCVKDSNQISNQMLFQFTSQKSLNEPVIFYHYNSSYIPLVASEAKGLYGSLFEAYPQAISLASDIALNIMNAFPLLKYDDIVVPYILTSWEHVQIGFVYLVKQSYPCTSILSNVLSLSKESDLVELCAWIKAIGNHCRRFIDNAIEIQSQSHIIKKIKSNFSSCFLSNSYIFKPIECVNEKLCRSTLCKLLNKFYKLWEIESLRDVIVFPSGVIGLPDCNSQPELYNGVFESYKYLFRTLKKSVPSRECKDNFKNLVRGHPIILYDNILLRDDEDGLWKRGEMLKLETDIIKHEFIRRLKEIVLLIEETGIIHLDLRVYNIFYKCSHDVTHGTTNTIESSITSASVKVDIRIIDWDDSSIIERTISNKGTFDSRFPNTDIATKEVHSYFISSIVEFMNSSL